MYNVSNFRDPRRIHEEGNGPGLRLGVHRVRILLDVLDQREEPRGVQPSANRRLPLSGLRQVLQDQERAQQPQTQIKALRGRQLD